MKVEATEIPGVLLLIPKRSEDARGFFTETYNANSLKEAGIWTQFVQDDLSCSRHAGTVRGLHYQTPPHAQTKLVRCSRGAIVDVALDIRIGSPTFGRYVRQVLTAENMYQLYIPTGFAHGFSTLTADTEVQYKVDAPYAPGCERGIAFDDDELNIDWQLDGRSPQLSEKDRQLPAFAALRPDFSYIALAEAQERAS